MTPTEARKAWIAALRSGHYEQGRAVLQNAETGACCCLGVACRVAMENGVELDVSVRRGVYVFDGWTGIMPQAVQRWLDVDFNDPLLDGRPASERNDRMHQSFSEIADAIERGVR